MNRPLLFLLALPLALRSQESPPERFDYRPATVVVFNSNDPASAELANYYAKQRGIPTGNLVGLKTKDTDLMTREAFQNEIENPLRAAFDERKWWETARTPKDGLVAVKTTMRVIAIMQGVPMKIGETSKGKDPKTGQEIPPTAGAQDAACVDSELAALGVLERQLPGSTKNPFFNAVKQFAEMPLTPIFLVGRIDGPDKATAKRMIDDAIAVEKTGLYGKAYIDLAQKSGGGYKLGEDWLINAGRILELSGVPVIMDTWEPTLPQNYPMNDCVLYLGWYAGNADGPFLNPAFRFRRGAIACHIHSFSAYTIKSNKLNWCGPLLSHGACATLGNVLEPYLPFTAHLDVFTDRLLSGFTLAEAAWMSTPALSWMSTVLGDPLYRPFAASASEADKKTDPQYKAIRLAMKRWGKPGDDKALTENLQRAAEKLKSPEIYEFLALHAQAGDNKDWPAAKKWFELATKAAKPAEQIRLQFLMADAMRRDGETKEALRTLGAVAEKNAAAPEAVAARALVQQIKETK